MSCAVYQITPMNELHYPKFLMSNNQIRIIVLLHYLKSVCFHPACIFLDF